MIKWVFESIFWLLIITGGIYLLMIGNMLYEMYLDYPKLKKENKELKQEIEVLKKVLFNR